MPTAKKLPSGNYRCRVYSHKENGKKVYQSFTASTKQGAELAASEWLNHKQQRSHITVKDAIEGYINAKENVLSPSTIAGYKRMQKIRYKTIENVPLTKLTNETMQLFVSELSKTLSPKTVSNIYCFLTAVIALYNPYTRFNVTLPRRIRKKQISPSDDDIRALFTAANPTLKKCIALSAFTSMRRGEISALKYSDINDNIIYIHADLVKDHNGKWIYKEPKTPDSVRYKAVPDEIIKLLGTGNPDDYVVKCMPDTITSEFCYLRDKMEMNIRFHDLRHYFASIGAALGVPELYVADFGGWKQNSHVLKSVYQNKITPLSDKYSSIMNEHFSEILTSRGKSGDSKYDTPDKELSKINA